MVIAMLDCLNECNFAVKFHDKTKAEQVKELMRAGLRAWYAAANDPSDYDGEYFTSEEIQGFYYTCYAEPTMELLEKYKINADLIAVEYDKNDEIINADEVIYY